jgi:hypothetical protein
MDEFGYFPILLQDVLWELGNTVKPFYVTDLYSDPVIGDYYLTRVHIRERLETFGGLRSRSVHDYATPHTTYATSISNTAKRALWSLCYHHGQELHTTMYRHLPRHTSGIEEMVVSLENMEKTASTSLPKSLLHSTPTSRASLLSSTGLMRSCRRPKLGSLNWRPR